MIIHTYEGGYSLQTFDRMCLGGTDLACVFAPDGKLLYWFDAELAAKYPRGALHKKINDHIFMHVLMTEMEEGK